MVCSLNGLLILFKNNETVEKISYYVSKIKIIEINNMLIINKKQCGFSMIEVLVSLLVIGVGLLGMSGLQLSAMKSTSNAHSRTTASILAFSMAEKMRANPNGLEGGFYDDAVNCTQQLNQCRDAVCSAENIAKLDVQEVMCGVLTGGTREGGILNLLPSGSLTISCVGGCEQDRAVHDISIDWGHLNVHKDQTADETQNVTIAVNP